MNGTLIDQGLARILYVEQPEEPVSEMLNWGALCEDARALGFDAVLTPPLYTQRADGVVLDPDRFAFAGLSDEAMPRALAPLAKGCAQAGMALLMDVSLDPVDRNAPLARAHPDWFQAPGGAMDPRSERPYGVVYVRQTEGHMQAGLRSDWATRLSQWCSAGVSGFRFKGLERLSPQDWQQLIDAVRRMNPGCRFLAWTPGLTAEQVISLRGVGFSATFLSLPWWDFRAGWLAEEYDRLCTVAPVFAPIASDTADRTAADRGATQAAWNRRLSTAVLAGDGILMSSRFVQQGSRASIQKANEKFIAQRCQEPLRVVSGPLSAITAIFRGGEGLVLNPSSSTKAPLDWAAVQARLPDSYVQNGSLPSDAQEFLAPAECRRFVANRATLIRPSITSSSRKRQLGLGLMSAERIAIERVQPALDDGRFAVKATVGQSLNVQADVFMDGHEHLAVRLVWRAADEVGWHETPMESVGNDRWLGAFTPTRLGRHLFFIKAWLDVWESYRAGLKKRRDAKADIEMEVREGRLMMADVMERLRHDAPLAAAQIERAMESGDVNEILSDATAHAMASGRRRPFETSAAPVYPVMAERREASFSAWYELFPRSQGPGNDIHGTFSDVKKRLPAIRDMGFDVLYFPPIHPIGATNRKGRNNALTAQPDDPGSPYAIGSEGGGHDAVHPQLGTLEDFRSLLADARRHGLEVALDFAIQCSPDHPWLTEHRGWFSWRPDGSLRYAENPPKRYEDIVNPDFYQSTGRPNARASLWRALRDVVLFWIEQGVRIFRVDNPHTKPLPFWEWMLGEVHAQHPDVIFLSEAFTRPKVMYRLGKLGFSQSYTYFTWRNDKRELTSYLEELVAPPASLSLRPNFFVNTPDINPYFLQTSGRPGFLIRAALAATLSGSWGMYNGFELCEAQALPGREEYLDSEKYELRAWDWNRPANIIAQITQLNRIRKSTPALHTHLGLRFHTAHDDSVLFFSKSTPEADSIVLVAVCLDPHEAHNTWIELPMWVWGQADDATVRLEDACANSTFELEGKHHQIRLTPEQPYLIWRIRGAE